MNIVWSDTSHPCLVSSTETLRILERTTEVVPFDVKDAKGRAVGGYAVATQSLSRDDMFYIRTQATRNGDTFGAISRPTQFVGSLEDAQIFAAKKLEAARRRAVKAVPR